MLPIFGSAAVGFVLRRITRIDLRTLSTVSLFVLNPCLILSSFLTGEFPLDLVPKLTLFCATLLTTLGAIAWGSSRLPWRHSPGNASMLMLSSMFPNAGNYGLPLVLFVLGEESVPLALVFILVESIFLYSVGAFLASGGRYPLKDSIKAVLRLPNLYAAVMALVVRATGFQVPSWILEFLSTFGTAAIPMMLLLLGTALADMKPRIEPVSTAIAVGIRLLVSPAIALALAGVLGLNTTVSKIVILQAAAPSAVMTMILPVEFGGDWQLASAVVLVSTMASIVTVPLWIMLLG